MKKERFYALDVFRGATVALMITVNNPGSWDFMYRPLDHAPWFGCTPTDLVYPFFLFAVGNAMAFVMPRLREAGDSIFYKKVIKRTILIFLIGLFLNWCPFVEWSSDNHLVFKHWADVRIMGVLQRIALSYFFASLFAYYLKPKYVAVVAAAILLLYWGLCYAFGAPGDPFSMSGFFGTKVDKAILGVNHLYMGEGQPFDPEGLGSGLNPIVQIMIGYLVGHHIVTKGKTYEMLSQLFVHGAILLLVALIWNQFFPYSKKIWSSSFVVYTSGLAITILSCIIYWIEFRNKKGALTRFFDVFGKNPLFIFVLSGLLPRLLWLIRWPSTTADRFTGQPFMYNPLNWIYHTLCEPLFADPRNGSLMYSLINIAFYWMIVFWMDKKKIYVKV